MTDSRTGYDEDSLPWLQEVEDEDAPSGISGRAMFVGLVLVLALAAAIAAGFFWVGRSDVAAGSAPELIRAPEGPYKVKPQDPGGLDIAGESQTTFQTSAGQDVDSRLDLDVEGEQVAPKPPKAQPKSDAPGDAKAVEPAEVPAPAPVPAASAASGSMIQLGAYKNVAQAERAWTALSTRFNALSGLSKVVVPYSAGGSSGYRLRAAAGSPDEARQACAALQAGGESCFIAR